MGAGPVRWGMIGCGSVTEVKSGPALRQAKNSTVVAVMRRDGQLAADYARRHGVPRWYDDARALLSDPEVDAVYVATPPSTHSEYACMAMRAGKPVYVEKPMAMNAAECDQMLAASTETGLPLFVAYYRRALRRFLEVRKLLECGSIGEVGRVRARLCRTLAPTFQQSAELPWRVRPEISGGGLFVDLGSHTLDILDFLFGPLQAISGEAVNRAGAYPAEDMVRMSFTCGDGIQGEGFWDFNADAPLDEVVVEGEHGSLRFATFGDSPITIDESGRIREITFANPRHIQQPLIEGVVAELRGEGRSPSTGVSAARTTRVIDQVLGSYRRQNAVSRP